MYRRITPQAVACLLLLGSGILAGPARADDTGLLRYTFPERARPMLGPLLTVGAVLLVTDSRTLRGFDTDAGESKPDDFFRAGNALGDGKTLALALGGLYAAGGKSGRRAALLGVAALIDATAATVLMKGLTGKERPIDSGGKIRWHGPRWGDTSFPSGHAAAATAVAHVLAHEYPRQRWVWYGLAAGVAVSRVSSRRHWLSDVYFGAGVGLVCAESALRQQATILGWRF